MTDLSLFDFDAGPFDPGGFTHLSQLIECRAIVAGRCVTCRQAWPIGLPTLRRWLRVRGDVKLADLGHMRCQAGPDGRGCGRRGVELQWLVRRTLPPALDQRVAWDGRSHRRRGRARDLEQGRLL